MNQERVKKSKVVDYGTEAIKIKPFQSKLEISPQPTVIEATL